MYPLSVFCCFYFVYFKRIHMDRRQLGVVTANEILKINTAIQSSSTAHSRLFQNAAGGRMRAHTFMNG